MAATIMIDSPWWRKPILIVIAVTIMFGISEADFMSLSQKNIVLQNWDNITLEVRCFSFQESKDVHALKPKEKYLISFWQDPVFTMTTMWNCSTIQGTLIAFKDDYECNGKGNITCSWRFDRHFSYIYSDTLKQWVRLEFNPNYESLDRGGVQKGSNKLLWL